MAIDRNKGKTLIEDIDKVFEATLGKLNPQIQQFVKERILGPALTEFRELITDSRAPSLFLIGRSGHGKSSVINMLAGKRVAEVGDVKPTTPGATLYLITFEDKFASWNVVDSRGLFETTPPAGAVTADSVEALKVDLRKYEPDVILHVVSAPEARNLERDLEVFKELRETMIRQGVSLPPAIVALNKVDLLDDPRDWPPEVSARKAGQIKKCLDYMARILLVIEPTQIDRNFSIRGYTTSDTSYPAIIPICALEGDEWNRDTLVDYIGGTLPKSALLDFAQAARRKHLLRRMSTDFIKRFSGIATAIGATPIPVSDMAILIPLQQLMVAVVGGLSCRLPTLDTAKEYLAAAGINLAVAFAARELARWATEFAPPVAAGVSGALAGTITYGIGKSAEHYFFAGEIRKPEEFKQN